MTRTFSLEGPAGELRVHGAQLDLDIVEAITDASLKMSTSEVTELALTIDDRRFEALATGLFDPGTTTVPGSRVDYAELALELRAMELSPQGQLSLAARSWPVSELKRPTPSKVSVGLSPSAWVAAEARAAGLKAVCQPTPSAATVTLQQNETRWDTMQRLAKELGFICFEAIGTVFFGKPTWLISRKDALTLNVTIGSDRQPLDGRILARPSLRRSSDAATKVAELSVDVLPELGQGFLPGDVLHLSGMPVYSGKYLIDSVDIDLADNGIVSISASTPVDPTPQPPQAPSTGGVYGASGTTNVALGAGTYGGRRMDAQQMAAASAIYRQGVKDGMSKHDIVLAFMCVAQESNFRPLKVNSEGDSGYFQQRSRARDGAYYGTEAQTCDPEWSAHVFFKGVTTRMGTMRSLTGKGDGGLPWNKDKVIEWKTIAWVQRPGKRYETWYQKHKPFAVALTDAFEHAAKQAAASGTGGTGAGGATGSKLEAFVQLALKQAGKRYLQTRSISYGRGTNPRVFDCSSLVYWAAVNTGFNLPSWALNTSQQHKFATQRGLWIPVERGLRTRGAILWKPGHTAISLGNGRTIEAMGTKYGVLEAKAGHRFTRAWMLPGS